jgi:hypothetical protein
MTSYGFLKHNSFLHKINSFQGYLHLSDTFFKIVFSNWKEQKTFKCAIFLKKYIIKNKVVICYSMEI